MMLDGTMSTSFFDRFRGELRTCIKDGKLQSHMLQAFIETKEVDYEKSLIPIGLISMQS